MLQNCSVKYWSLPVLSKISKSAFGHEMYVYIPWKSAVPFIGYVCKFQSLIYNWNSFESVRMRKRKHSVACRRSHMNNSSLSPTGISENTRKQCMIKNNVSLFISARRVYWQPKPVFSHIILLLFSLLDILVSVSLYKLNTFLSVFIYYVKRGKTPKYDDGRKYFLILPTTLN